MTARSAILASAFLILSALSAGCSGDGTATTSARTDASQLSEASLGLLDKRRRVAVPPLTTTDGSRLDITTLRPRIVVMNFFASWCGPCREEAPELRAVSLDKDYALIGVAFKDRPESATAFAREMEWDYPIVPAGTPAGQRLGVQGNPATFVFDRSSRLVATIHGQVTADQIYEVARRIG